MKFYNREKELQLLQEIEATCIAREGRLFLVALSSISILRARIAGAIDGGHVIR